jgi:hypothetical protein
VLTDTQQRAIEVVASACSQRPLPAHVTDGSAAAAAETPTGAAAAAAAAAGFAAADGPLSPGAGAAVLELASFEGVVLQNSSEFYK